MDTLPSSRWNMVVDMVRLEFLKGLVESKSEISVLRADRLMVRVVWNSRVQVSKR
jgi:hypothetical protein